MPYLYLNNVDTSAPVWFNADFTDLAGSWTVPFGGPWMWNAAAGSLTAGQTVKINLKEVMGGQMDPRRGKNPAPPVLDSARYGPR